MAKPGLDLIKNQNEPELVSQLTQSLQIARLGMDDADVLQDRLGDEAGNWISLADIADRIEVVKVYGMDQAAMPLGDSGTERGEAILSRRDARPNFGKRRHQIAGDVVMPAVVATLHHDKMIASGSGTGQANRLARSFTARIQ